MLTAMLWKLQSGAPRGRQSSPNDDQWDLHHWQYISRYEILQRIWVTEWIYKYILSGSQRQAPKLFDTRQKRNSTITQNHGKGGSDSGRDTQTLPHVAVTQDLGARLQCPLKQGGSERDGASQQRRVKCSITALKSRPWKHHPCWAFNTAILFPTHFKNRGIGKSQLGTPTAGQPGSKGPL